MKYANAVSGSIRRQFNQLCSCLSASVLVAGLLVAAIPVAKAHALGVQANGCYDGFVLVPGDATYSTSDFCVMEWEAKDVGGVATSEADNPPWDSLSQTAAKTAAANACPGGACHLITDHEWMTIAANVERQPENWTGGAVGSGCLYIGNAYNTTCGYFLGGYDYGTGRNTRARYTLSNGSQIWDFSGNAREWTDATVQSGDMPQPSGTDDYTNVTNFGTLSYINPLANTAGLPGGANSWTTAAQGIGQMLSGYSYLSTTVYGLVRGGQYGSSITGPFALNLYIQPSASNASVGFRVAQAPLSLTSAQLQNTNRSVTLSSSAADAANVTYKVAFSAGTNYSLQTIIVDFCSNSPLLGDDCTAPNGFSVGATPTVSNMLLGGAADGGSWTATALNSGRTLQYTRSASVVITKGETVSFELTGVTNPSATDTFYGRILGYSLDYDYTDTAPGPYQDGGGVALSINQVVNVTAIVQETLQFCVYHSSCGDSPAVTLGHGDPLVLDSSEVNTAADSFNLSTNAGGGVVVTAQGSPLSDGSATIPAVANGNATGGSLSKGTAAFGVAVSTPGDLTIPAAYQGDGTATGHYAFDTTSTPNLTSAYGQPIASSTGVLDNSISTLSFAATASTTTPAGVYTTDMALVATGTF